MPDEKLQFIIDNLQEGLEVEVKNWLNALRTNDDKARLAKEIIALANNGGGYIFVGFDDQGPELGEIQPSQGDAEAFTQDAVASVVQRYVSPPCQCRLDFLTPTGSDITHPVIIVPGDHRTPLFAARGNDNTDLQPGRVYVRRPGGYSELARNQDDWEKLIERLVKARQSEMLGAIREILNPSSKIITEEESTLEDWQAESYAIWQQIVGAFDDDDPRRLTEGHWTVSFSVRPFEVESLAQLNSALDREMPKHSGWPPFTYLHRDPIRPHAEGNFISAYIGAVTPEEQPQDRADHADYWRISRDGKGFMLRPMQEDRARYPGQVYPQPERPLFDWVFPVYRVTEVLKFIEALGQRFGQGEAPEFELLLTYFNTVGRRLYHSGHQYILFDGAQCHINQVDSRISAPVSEISTNLEELVFALLAPVYEQFDFTELPQQLVTNVVAEVLSYRN